MKQHHNDVKQQVLQFEWSKEKLIGDVRTFYISSK